MSREIKFRFWDKDRKTMQYQGVDRKTWYFDNEYDSIHFPLDIVGFMSYKDSDDAVLMQYTGLKDKNGIEVYEGDIVEDWDDGPGYWEVKWDSECGCFYIFESNIWEKFYSDDMIGIFSEGKVIGNIYENPDLIEGEE